MITDTKTSIQSMISNIESSYKSSKSSFVSESTPESYKADNKRDVSKETDFKKVLDTKTSVRDNKNSEKVDDNSENDTTVKADDTTVKDNDTDDIDQLKEKLDKLEEESKSASKDKASDVLEELAALLAKFGIKEDTLKTDGKLNSDILKNIINKISEDKASGNNLDKMMEKIMELLKNDSVKSRLDADSLKTMEKLLSNLSSNLADDNTEVAKDIKNNLKNLMSEVSNMLDNKQAAGNKVLTLEDMLNKNYSQNNSGNSSKDSNTATLNEDKNNTAAKNSKELSKEDKFLNSLADDSKDSSLDKINLFASRNAAVQNQNVNAVTRGLTINKATFVDDLIKDVKFMNTNSLKELTVKVNPGNLGEITIKLVQEDDVMKANLKANSKETTALLSQNLADIKKQLSDQNIKVSEVNIELYQDDTTFFKDQSFNGQLASGQNGQNGNSKSRVAATEGVTSEELDENLAQENNNISFFA